MLRYACLMLAVFTLSGCAIARSGPGESAITEKAADLAGFTLIPMSAAAVANYRVSTVTDATGTAGVPPAPPISLSSGDMLKVRIAESKEGGLFSPLATGGTSFDNLRIDYKGTISIPYVGRVKVAGLDPQQVEDRVRARLSGVAFEPQVTVEVLADRGSSVLVSGEVKSAGRFSLLEGPLTLVDAIAKAGGATKPAHQMDVLIRRGRSVVRLPLQSVLNGNNQQLRSGDEVILAINAKVFNSLGAVAKNGQNEFLTPNPTLMDALAQIGGLNGGQASATGVFVFRLREHKAWLDADNHWREGPVIFQFDFSKPETMFIAQAFGMHHDDTIYVTTAPAIEWVKRITPIAATMTTIRSAISLNGTLDSQFLSTTGN